MTVTIPIRVQHKHMTKEDWSTSDVVLLLGELGIESDTGMVKVGDGVKTYNELSYLTGPKGDRGEVGPIGEMGPQGLTGERGPKGEKGDAFRYEHFTPEQLEGLRGPAGRDGTVSIESLTQEQKNQLLDGYVSKDVYSREIEDIKNDYVKDAEYQGVIHRFINDFSQLDDRFLLKDEPIVLSEEQKQALKGEPGERGPKGDPFTYEDLSLEQKAELRGVAPDLSIYATKTELANKANSNHNHDAIYLKKREVPSLTNDLVRRSELVNKADASHSHVSADITDASSNFGGPGTGNVLIKTDVFGRVSTTLDPTSGNNLIRKSYADRTYASSNHNHAVNEITGLQEQVNHIGKILVDGNYLSVIVVDFGRVPSDTRGLIVFERKA